MVFGMLGGSVTLSGDTEKDSATDQDLISQSQIKFKTIFFHPLGLSIIAIVVWFYLNPANSQGSGNLC